MNLFFLLPLLVDRKIKCRLPVVEPDDMNQFMSRNIKHQGAQANKGVSPFHGIKDSVVLEADPVEVESPFLLLPLRLPMLIVFAIMIFAEMSKSPFPDLMFFQKRQSFHVVAMGLDRFRTQAKILAGQSLCMLKNRTRQGYLCRTEIPAHRPLPLYRQNIPSIFLPGQEEPQ
jgi:hypothetical protein